MNMTETIIVALITGGLSLLGVIITSNKTTRDVQAKLDTQQAVTDTKLDELTREVREHNSFARRMPVYAGDDLTDEAAIAEAQARGGIGIKIGEGETVARYRLPGPPALAHWLDRALGEED